MTPTPASLHGPDFLMLGGYFVLMLAIGAYFYRHMRRMKDYFTGGNTIPWWLSGVSFYMTSFSVAAFVYYPSLCYRYGWIGVTLLWVAVPATIFSAFVFGIRWRRARIDSPVEYIETRYGPALRQVFVWQGLPVKVIDNGLRLVATGTFISVCTGLSKTTSILSAGGIMLLYTLMGGLWAVAVTDFVQFVVLSAGLLIILPLSVSKAGGLGAIWANSPEGFFHMTAPGYGWGYVLVLVIMYALAWSSINWSLIQRYYCVPKERDVIKVGALVVGLYIIGPPLMFFPGIAARQFLPPLDDAGHVYPLLCAQLLPPGMLGLAIAAMFSATMSTLSSEYNICANVLTNDVYRRLVRPNASQAELVNVGRLMTLLVGGIVLAVAFLIVRQAQAQDLFDVMVKLFSVATPPVAVPMLLGLVSRKVSKDGALAGFLAGFAVGLALFFLPKVPEFTRLGVTWKPGVEELVLLGMVWKLENVQFLSAVLTTLAVTLGVSAWRPMTAEARARTEAFCTRLETPIGALEEDRPALDKGAELLSPFRVVGYCIVAVGVLLLIVLPWVNDPLAFRLDAALGLGLIVVGALWVWRGRRPGDLVS